MERNTEKVRKEMCAATQVNYASYDIGLARRFAITVYLLFQTAITI